MSSHASLLALECPTKSDAWGRIGSSSLATRFAQAMPGATFRYKESEPYSEMWMGAYPSLPARLLSSGEELGGAFNGAGQCGEVVGERRGGEIWGVAVLAQDFEYCEGE